VKTFGETKSAKQSRSSSGIEANTTSGGRTEPSLWNEKGEDRREERVMRNPAFTCGDKKGKGRKRGKNPQEVGGKI